MRTIAHLSDLHFGTEDGAMARRLLADLEEISPSLVVVSGDLTQRAKTSEFEAAANWLGQIPFPRLVVPGNHDIPLYDVVRRFASPLGRYSRYITPELDPYFGDEEIAVLGINTARSLTWKSGRISTEQIRLISRKMGGVKAGTFKILVTHHPFIPPPGEAAAGIDLVRRAARALTVIDRGGVDLLLAGHLHHGYTGDVRTYYPATSRSVVVAQAGTAISRRIRAEPNAYNLITLEKERITVQIRVWVRGAFEPSTRVIYCLHGKEWRSQI